MCIHLDSYLFLISTYLSVHPSIYIYIFCLCAYVWRILDVCIYMCIYIYTHSYICDKWIIAYTFKK